MRPENPYDLGGTFDHGCYRSDKLLRGHLLHGVREGVRTPDDHPVLITVRLHHWDSYPLEGLRLPVPGVAPLLFCGPPDRYTPPKVRTVSGTVGAVIESRPAGVPLSEILGRLDERDIVRIGLGLTAMLAATDPVHPILGIRPETTYIVGEPEGMRLGGVAPRSIRILSHHHDGIARAFTHSYEAPELYTTGASAPTTDLFSAALTLWTGFTGAHAYRVTPHDVDEDVIAADDRGPFAGPVELGRILEPILRADPATRPSITQVDDQLRHLAHGWGLEIPPFPPTWD